MKKISILNLCFFVLFSLCQGSFASSLETNKKWSISFEAGATPQGSTSFRLIGAYWLSKTLELTNNITGSLRIELDMGILDTTDTAFDIGFQPVARLEYKGWNIKPYLDFGAGIHFLSRANIDDRKLGGGHQFSLTGGTGVCIGNGIEIGYRYFHISNANIHSHNHGRDEHLSVITFYF